jgi:hypothetical protein
MNIAVVKNALGSLDRLLSQAKRALGDVETEMLAVQGEDMQNPVTL